jgi:hypothetical protein
LFTLKPLFPGQSEIDQLFKISEVLGSPNVKSELAMQVGGIGGGEWKEGVKLAKTLGFSFPQVKNYTINLFIPYEKKIQLDLITHFQLLDTTTTIV